MSASNRRVASIVLAVAGSVLALVGGVALYAREEIFDPDAFADNSAETLKDGDVREALADPIADQAIDRGPDELINVRPVLLAAIEGVLESTPFRAMIRKAARKAHRAIFAKDREEIPLTVGNADVLITDAVAQVDPQLAKQIPQDLGDRLFTLTESDAVLTAVRVSEDARILGMLLPLLALLSLGGSVAVAADRRRALLVAASAVAVSAVIGFIAFEIARGLVLSQFEDETVHLAAAAVWETFLGGLGTWILVLGMIAVLVAAAAAMARETDPVAPARRLLALATRTPESAWGRAGRAVAVAAVSLLFLLRPTLALDIVAVILGAYGLFFAACELLGLIAPPPRAPRARRRLPALRVAVGGAALLAALVIGVVVLATGDEGEREVSRPSGPIANCNGFAELCDKPLDSVAFPATHNSMSAAELPGWYQPNQRYDIRRQLDEGVRAFLIDTHYGIKRSSGPVLTDLEREGTSKVLEGVRAELGAEGAKAFRSIQSQFARRGGEGDPGSYLCHVVCELGSIKLVKALGWFRSFLDTHPDEFVVLFIEDKVSPSDTHDAFERSGLLHYAYIHKPGKGFPTMRELIENDKRLFVLAEEDSGDGTIPWYHQGFDLAMETPFTFTAPEQLAAKASCSANRGGVGKPLFQLNHWVEKLPRSPKTAAQVNDFGFLHRRARVCERRRDGMPTILGVDFYDKGDVVAVAAALNGVPEGAEPSYRESD